MTCRQLGGACDLAHTGNDHNGIIQAQDRHLREVVASGDQDHEPALREMKARWKRPISGDEVVPPGAARLRGRAGGCGLMPADDEVPARISAAIAALGDWRGELLATVRRLALEADGDVVEELKWVKPSNPTGVPTWSRAGILFTGQ